MPQGYNEAYIWYSIASVGGHDEAKENLERMKAKLSPEQLAEAQEQATVRFNQIKSLKFE